MSPPESIANYILDQLEIYHPDDLLLLRQIVVQRGAEYQEKFLEGAEARLTLGLKKPIISISTRISNPQRKRFSIAHELGHLELHARLNKSFHCSSDDIQYMPDLTRDELEMEANQFAGSFLIPSRIVKSQFSTNDPSFDLIKDWSERLQTSLTATAFRFVRYTPEPIAVVFSLNGVIQYFQSSNEFNELGVFPDVKGNVGRNSIAYQLFRDFSINKEWESVRANNWFRKNNNAFDSTDNVKEWSIGMPRYNSVLTLLWVDEPLGLYSN